MTGIQTRAATAKDCDFIARATMGAERAHLDTGIWDVYFAGYSVEDKLRCLSACSASCEMSHLHYKHFIIAEMENDAMTGMNNPVGSCSRYMDPVSARVTYDVGLKEVVTRLLNWSEKQHEEACARLNFLRDLANWPDLPANIFSGTCFIETVYTEAASRGKGVASCLLKRCIDDGKTMGAARCFLLAAIGNTKAINVYSREGFNSIAQLVHDDCQHALGVPGFDIMVQEFSARTTVLGTQ